MAYSPALWASKDLGLERIKVGGWKVAQERCNFLPCPMSMWRKEEPLAEKVEGEAQTSRGDWLQEQQTFKENIHRKGKGYGAF